MNHDLLRMTYRDGYIGACRWWPGGDKGAVLYLHGIQSHGLWFEQSAAVLAGVGFGVLLPDRRGSGVNDEARGDIHDYRQWITDAVDLMDWLRDKTGHRRIHVVGVSWGGKLAVALARTVPERLASLALVAPGIFPAVDVSLAAKLQIALAVVLGRKRYFPIPLNEPGLFTNNPERQDFIRRDTRRLTAVTGTFLYQSRRLDRLVRIFPERLTMPIKLFLAGDERIIDNAMTIRYYRGLRTTSVKELAFFPRAAHTLEFEHDNQPFIQQLQEWLKHAAI